MWIRNINNQFVLPLAVVMLLLLDSLPSLGYLRLYCCCTAVVAGTVTGVVTSLCCALLASPNNNAAGTAPPSYFFFDNTAVRVDSPLDNPDNCAYNHPPYYYPITEERSPFGSCAYSMDRCILLLVLRRRDDHVIRVQRRRRQRQQRWQPLAVARPYQEQPQEGFFLWP